MTPYERLKSCVKAIREKTDFVPSTALVLGSGLGGFGEKIRLETVVDYHEIPGFPVSTVPGHQGRFLFGYVGEEPVVVMQGRVHYYEGYPMEDVVLPIRVMGLLGAKRLVLTNAAGGIGPDLEPGDLMLLTDQISSFVPSPLLGQNVEELGPRFPDMTEIYSPRLREKALAAAGKLGFPLKQGVYLQATGPQYESPAEIRMFRTLGANAVGMSTACEAIAARHMGLEICGISCVTNLAAGLGGAPLSHQEVQQTADRVAQRFQALVWELISTLGEER
ncbi:MAG: purine-nucleoside phosphorylase [Acutalibacter sp.]